jgi:hypothetical protein
MRTGVQILMVYIVGLSNSLWCSHICEKSAGEAVGKQHMAYIHDDF